MKILTLIGFLVGSLVLGLILRFIARNKPKTEFVIWGILMIAMLFFFIYGLVLVIHQETPLFTAKHYANEFSVISSMIFLFLGIYYFKRRKKQLLGIDEKQKPLMRKTKKA